MAEAATARVTLLVLVVFCLVLVFVELPMRPRPYLVAAVALLIGDLGALDELDQAGSSRDVIANVILPVNTGILLAVFTGSLLRARRHVLDRLRHNPPAVVNGRANLPRLTASE